MAARYTDVDQLLLKRWDDSIALRNALDDLMDRMRDVVEESLSTLVTEFAERGILAEFYVKRPSIWFWLPSWARGKREPAIYLDVLDFAPSEYGRDVGAHPTLWLSTSEFSSLRFRETASDFGKAVRSALPPDLQKKWSHPNADLADSPLGLELTDVTDAERLRLVVEPGALTTFIRERVTSAMAEIEPAVREALSKMTAK